MEQFSYSATSKVTLVFFVTFHLEVFLGCELIFNVFYFSKSSKNSIEYFEPLPLLCRYIFFNTCYILMKTVMTLLVRISWNIKTQKYYGGVYTLLHMEASFWTVCNVLFLSVSEGKYYESNQQVRNKLNSFKIGLTTIM